MLMLLKQGFEMKIWMWEDGKTNNCFLMNRKWIRCNWNASANLFPLMYKSAQGRCYWTVLLHNLEALVCVCVCHKFNLILLFACAHTFARTHFWICQTSYTHPTGFPKMQKDIIHIYSLPCCSKPVWVFLMKTDILNKFLPKKCILLTQAAFIWLKIT